MNDWFMAKTEKLYRFPVWWYELSENKVEVKRYLLMTQEESLEHCIKSQPS